MSNTDEFVFSGMTPELRAYIDQCKYARKFGYDEYKREAAKAEELRKEIIPADLLSKYYYDQKKWMCRDSTQVGEVEIINEISGLYELHITHHKTGENTWQYTKCRIYNANHELITTLYRNYHSFPHLLLVGSESPNEHDYLICGEDYQSQTVVELDTGKIRHEKGDNFCWSSYKFLGERKLLKVIGCHWGGPYEVRFYDFSDPMNGWPLIESDEPIYTDENKEPIIEGNIVKSFQTKFYEYDEIVEKYGQLNEDGEKFIADDDFEKFEKMMPEIIYTTKTFEFQGNKLKLIDEYVSDIEKERRAKNIEFDIKWKLLWSEFKANDPLYKTYCERLKDPWLKPTDWESYGWSNGAWCSGFDGKCNGEENTLNNRIVAKKSINDTYTIDLSWAIKTGPIKLIIFKDGKHSENKFFEHSVEEMNKAFDFVRDLLNG